MRQNDQQLGKPTRLYRDTKANIQALGLLGGDEGCTAYAIDTNEFGTFNGIGWAWSNHLDWDDVWADAVHTHGSAAEGGVDLGPLDTITMADGGLVGAPGNLRIRFDYTNGQLGLELGDAAGADEVRVVDSAGTPVLHIDSNGNVTVADGAWQGIGAALERIVYSTAGSIVIEDADFGVGIGAPVYKCHIWTGNAGVDPAWEAAVRRGILIESSDEVHLTLFTPANKTGRLQFADPGGIAEGYVAYVHGTDILSLGNAGGDRITITAAGVTKILNLAGVGARNVVAAADGTLSAP